GEDWLERSQNNFIVAIQPGAPIGFAAIDLSTGEFYLHTVLEADLPSLMGQYQPSETVVPTGYANQSAGLVTQREAWEFDAATTGNDLLERYHVSHLDGLGIEPVDSPALAAAGALLRYIQELQPAGIPHLARPRVCRLGGGVLDEMTRRNLELVENLRGPDGSLTLIKILDRTLTPMGARLLHQRVVGPSASLEEIRSRLDAVAVMVSDGTGRERLRDALDGVRDLERLTSRAAAGRATPRDLGALRDSLVRLVDVRSSLDGFQKRHTSALLEQIGADFDLVSDLSTILGSSLTDAPPVHIGDADSIAAGVDDELDDARSLRDGGKEFIAGLVARERNRTGIPNLKVGFNKVFGYYIEITKSHKDSVPPEYERRQTLTNAERYATPELKSYEEKVLTAEDRIDQRERALIRQLCSEVGSRTTRLQMTAQLTAQLDVFQSLAETAVREGYTHPTVTDGFDLDLRGCRHPVVEQMMPRGQFIQNDVALDASGRVVLLTGPNMAGKSTILRQIGLAAVMAQMGSFVAADSAVIGLMDRIFTRVGASDNLVRGQSTFMVEMSETSAILHAATNRSLVLLDEIGRGTSTFDGVAIAWAVTEFLHDRVGCKTVFATHYHELTQLTEHLQHARNFNVVVREADGSVMFLHRLEPGSTDRSYGIHVGELAGLPQDVVQRAWQVLAILETDHRVAGVPPPQATDANQLQLFASNSDIMEQLRGMDPDSMTPIEALGRLAELKRRAEES
ncbi:MAG: DNA mismatch repair protein MutS, partial [Gemmatimonadales bacterium]